MPQMQFLLYFVLVQIHFVLLESPANAFIWETNMCTSFESGFFLKVQYSHDNSLPNNDHEFPSHFKSEKKCSPNNLGSDELEDLSLGYDSVVNIQSTIFPLHRTVHIESITQPIVRTSSVNTN